MDFHDSGHCVQLRSHGLVIYACGLALSID